MRRRYTLAIGIGIMLAVVLYRALLRSDESPPVRHDPLPTNLERSAGPQASAIHGAISPAASPDPEGHPAPPAQFDTLEEAQEHSRAILESVGRFVTDATPRLETCIGPTTGPHLPRNVLVTFRRPPTDNDAEFRPALIEPLPPSPGAPPLDEQTLRCLQDLKEVPLIVSLEHGPMTSEVQRVVTLVLPTTQIHHHDSPGR